MRKFIVDTTVSVVVFTILAACIELFIAGMEPMEVLTARLIMMPLMVLTGRPYGMWRDGVFQTLKPEGNMTKTIVDSAAFLSFQLPIYAVTLWVAGADRTEMLTALGSAAIMMLVVSRPFGLLLDAVRKWAGVPTA